MIVIESKGSFKNTENFLNKAGNISVYNILEFYAREGVTALSNATPKRTGLTSESWDYKIDITNKSYSITWLNHNVVDRIPVAILLQYGHGTGTGGYIQGYDYINPALKSVFDKLAEDTWKAVTSA